MSGNDKIGDCVRITGATDFYQGEPELQVSKDGSGKDLVMLLGEGDPVEPAEGNAGGILNRRACRTAGPAFSAHWTELYAKAHLF